MNKSKASVASLRQMNDPSFLTELDKIVGGFELDEIRQKQFELDEKDRIAKLALSKALEAKRLEEEENQRIKDIREGRIGLVSGAGSPSLQGALGTMVMKKSVSAVSIDKKELKPADLTAIDNIRKCRPEYAVA